MPNDNLDMSVDDFHVGQEVWVVPIRGHGNSLHSTIEKIGRRWITLSKYKWRFDPETGLVDGNGYSSPARVYLSKDDWEATLEVTRLWDAFRSATASTYTFKPPSADAVREAAKALGVTLPNQDGEPG